MDVDKSIKIYVAGHRGMVGSAIVRALNAQGFTNVILDLIRRFSGLQFGLQLRIGFVL